MRQLAIWVPGPLCCLLAACDRGPCGGSPPALDLPASHVLLQPDAPELKLIPPDSFDVRLETTKGDIVFRVYRAWAPLGVYRFYNLARNGFYDGSRFFRVLPGFAAQFGLSGRPGVDTLWLDRMIPDDPRFEANRAGTIAFATRGPDTRTTQLFFNYRDNPGLDEMGFTPFGRVRSGMDALQQLHSEGELQPNGPGPSFECLLTHGNRYLDKRFPELDAIQRVTIME